MKTLTVTLKQHTPLIHFQHDQYGATLRASEVKPKLDRFILGKLGGEQGYAAGKIQAKENGWFVGKGEHPALDYKMKIIPGEKTGIHLRDVRREDGQLTTEEFPLLLANMGGRDTVDELMNFSMYGNVTVKLICGKDDLYDELMKQFPYFIASTNFGQRSNKGFGSFTVTYIEDYIGKKRIDFLGYNPSYIVEDTLYMDFCLEKNIFDDEAIYTLRNQKLIFKVIENYWNRLRKSINMDTSVDFVEVDSVEAYIKGMKFIKIDDKNVQRLPAPITFKPIFYIDEENLNVSIYIMPDYGFLERLYCQYGDNSKITDSNELSSNIADLNYIDVFSENMIHPRYHNLRMQIGDETVDVEFCGH